MAGNTERVLSAITEELLRERDAAFGTRWDHMLHYDRLPHMRFGRIDEFEWLSRCMLTYLEKRKSADSRRFAAVELLDGAARAAEARDEETRAERVMSAFSRLYPLCL